MPRTFPTGLAHGVTTTDVPAVFELFAGDRPVTTDQASTGATALAALAVIGRITATGKIVPHNPAAVDGSQNAMGITAQAIPANTRGPIYTGGSFNHAVLVWNAATDTLDERKAAFDGTPIQIGDLA